MYGLQVWIIDWADHAVFACVAANEDQLDFVLRALEAIHCRPVVRSEAQPSARVTVGIVDGD